MIVCFTLSFTQFAHSLIRFYEFIGNVPRNGDDNDDDCDNDDDGFDDDCGDENLSS